MSSFISHPPHTPGSFDLDTGPAPSSDLSVTLRPANLRDRYARLVFISHYGQLAGWNHDRSDLIVSTDWISWQKCLQAGHDVVHYEYGLRTWTDAMGDPDTVYLRACNWMYVDGRDVTEFLGVSLGKTFNGHVATTFVAALRLQYALVRIIEEFQPCGLVFFDLRTEYDFVDRPSRERIVRDLGASYGLKVEADPISDVEPLSESFMDFYPWRSVKPEKASRSILRKCYELAVDFLSAIGSGLGPRRNGVYLLHNPLVISCLVESFVDESVRPILLARQYKKIFAFVSDCLKRGVALAALPSVRLSSIDKKAILAMRDRLEMEWRTPAASAPEQACRNVVVSHILRPEVLEALARDVKAFGVLFRRHRVKRLVVGDAVNQTARLLLGIAARDGIAADEFPNGMFLAKQQMDARVGDGVREPLLRRFLAWGESNDRWLASAGKGIEHIRIGYPLVGKFRQMRFAQSSGRGRALVLPLHVDRLDIRGLYGEVFSTLCETVRELGQIGFNDIRVKVHPGYQNVRYYADALELRGLECDVIIDGPLLPHLDWADIVVGPVNSGAMVETLALGRPYYPMRNLPNSLDPDLFCGVTVYETAHELKTAVARGTQIDADAALGVFAGYDGKRDPAGAMWNAIAAGCNANSQLLKG